MSRFENNSIFWVEVHKIKPNPYQPRREFDEERLRDLADSIRQYGVLQPLVVTRQELPRDDGGLSVEYELIAGERRHRAAGIAGLSQVPVIIRSGRESAKEKLELAIIENLQREDLNPIDRARAFKQLVDEFDFKHSQVAKKVGKSREYVSNSIRLLMLPENIQGAIVEGRMTEGHARPLMMLGDRPEEQATLFKEVVFKKITVREAEKIARKIAHDKVRKRSGDLDPKIRELEKELSETFGTRVQIESKDVGGKVVINFFSDEDLEGILMIARMQSLSDKRDAGHALNSFIESQSEELVEDTQNTESSSVENQSDTPDEIESGSDEEGDQTDDKPDEASEANDEDLYSISNFSL